MCIVFILWGKSLCQGSLTIVWFNKACYHQLKGRLVVPQRLLQHYVTRQTIYSPRHTRYFSLLWEKLSCLDPRDAEPEDWKIHFRRAFPAFHTHISMHKTGHLLHESISKEWHWRQRSIRNAISQHLLPIYFKSK